MRATKLQLLVNDKFFENVMIPNSMEKEEQFKKQYDIPVQRTMYGYVDKNTYSVFIGNSGFITKVTEPKTEVVLIKHVLNDGTGFPIGFKTNHIMKKTERYKIECVLQEFRMYYDILKLVLYFEGTSYLRFIDVNPEVGIKIVFDHKKSTEISLFKELHRYYVENRNLRATDRLHKIYGYYMDKNGNPTTNYRWFDEFGNDKSIGNLTIDNFDEFHNKSYELRNENDVKIVGLKLILVPTLKYVEYLPTKSIWSKGIKMEEPGVKLIRDVIVQDFETRRVTSRHYDLPSLFISDTQKWVFLNETPTYDLVLKKIEIFETKIIDIVPEAIRFTDFEPNIDYQLKNENKDYGLDTSGDNNGILACLIELQTKWKEEKKNLLENYEFDDDLFALIIQIRLLIRKQFLDACLYIGYMLCNRYFAFDGRKVIDPINYTRTGTFVHVTTRTGEKRAVEYHNPSLVSVVFSDRYNSWYRGLWKNGKYQNETGKFHEEIVDEIDIEIVHFYDVGKITETTLVPAFTNEQFGKSRFIYKIPNKINVVILLISGGNLIRKMEGIKKGGIIDFTYKTDINGHLNTLVYGNNSYTTSNESIDLYVIQHLSVSTKVGVYDDNNVYKHFKILDVIRLNFKRFLGTITMSSSHPIGSELLKILSSNRKYILRYPNGTTRVPLVETLQFSKVNPVEGTYRISPDDGSDDLNQYVSFRFKTSD